ncbi:MAG: prepilin peptidase [Sphaerospermopsis sp. SIO1G2]|nr:prepilin peptidase [Sphaerospermopsis sp. SIO1G2]
MDALVFLPTSIIVFGLGAAIGSFINVVVYRLPAGLSLLWPPSRCPKCLNQLKAYDNVPVFGWLWLKGKCRYCQTKISPRYPLVEAATGVIFLIVFWLFQFSFLTVGYWAFCSWLLALSLIDWDTMTLPGPLTKSGLVLGLCFQISLGYFTGPSWNSVVKYLIFGIGGVVLGLWLFDSISILGSIAFGKPVMGAGDAKLSAMMGAWLGWKYLLVAAFLACFFGAVVGGGAMMFSRHQMGQRMPFGPFLALGAVIAAFAGEAIVTSYLQLVLPVT